MECRTKNAVIGAVCVLGGLVASASFAGGARNFGNVGGGGTGGGGGGDNRAEITITESRPIQFGRVVASVQGGAITVSPDGVVSTSGSVQALDTPLEGIFDLTGEPGADFTVSFQSGGVMSSSGQSIGVISEATPSYAAGQFDGDGNAVVRMGAQMTLNGVSSGLEGTGSYTILVNYTN